MRKRWQLLFRLILIDFILMYKGLQLWWWTRGMEKLDVKNEEPLVRATLQGLRKAEFKTDTDVVFDENGHPYWLSEALKSGRTEEEI